MIRSPCRFRRQRPPELRSRKQRDLTAHSPLDHIRIERPNRRVERCHQPILHAQQRPMLIESPERAKENPPPDPTDHAGNPFKLTRKRFPFGTATVRERSALYLTNPAGQNLPPFPLLLRMQIKIPGSSSPHSPQSPPDRAQTNPAIAPAADEAHIYRRRSAITHLAAGPTPAVTSDTRKIRQPNHRIVPVITPAKKYTHERPVIPPRSTQSANCRHTAQKISPSSEHGRPHPIPPDSCRINWTFS